MKNLFNLFLSTNETKPVFLQPYTVGGYTYATDTYVMIRAKNEIIDFEITQTDVPNVKKSECFFKEPEIDMVINLESVPWEDLKTEDQMAAVGEDIKCGHCEGDGELDLGFLYNGKHYNLDAECPVCDGGGWEYEAPMVKTGLKEFNSCTNIQINNEYYDVRKLYTLKKASDIIGKPVKLVIDGKRPVFTCGDYEIIIMPLTEPTQCDDNVIVKI